MAKIVITRPSNISHFVAWTDLQPRFLCMASPLLHKNHNYKSAVVGSVRSQGDIMSVHYMQIEMDSELAAPIVKPDDYEVYINVARRKGAGDMLGFQTMEVVQIIIALEQSGFGEWLRNKAYEQLWDYLKAMSGKLPHSLIGRRGSIKVKDKNGVVRAELDLDRFDVENLSIASIEIKSNYEKIKGKKEKSSHTIKVETSNQ